MKRLIIPLGWSAFIIVLVMIYSALTHSLTAAALSDRFFLVSLPLLIISGFLWVRSSGFFRLFQQSFQGINKKQKKAELVTPAVSPTTVTFWLVLTGMLLGASILFLLIAWA